MTIDGPADGATFTEGDQLSASPAPPPMSKTVSWPAAWPGPQMLTVRSAVEGRSLLAPCRSGFIPSPLLSPTPVALSARTPSPSRSPANQAPVVTIDSPADGATFTEGDSVGFAGTATDAEDGVLTAGLVLDLELTVRSAAVGRSLPAACRSGFTRSPPLSPILVVLSARPPSRSLSPPVSRPRSLSALRLMRVFWRRIRARTMARSAGLMWIAPARKAMSVSV